MELPIAIHKDRDSVYGVTIPDVPGCYSWGDTVDAAIKNARDAIYSHFEVLAESGDVPAVRASRIEDLSTDNEYAGAIWALVEVDTPRLLAKLGSNGDGLERHDS